MTIEWDGIEEFSRWLTTAEDATSVAVGSALFTEGEVIMGKAKRDTPVDTGRLRSTGHVTFPQINTSGTVSVDLAFGTDYAVFVHEIRDASHTVGRSKFLEANVKAASRAIAARLSERVRRALRQHRAT